MSSTVILVIIADLSGKYFHCHLVLIKFPSKLSLGDLGMCCGQWIEQLELSNNLVSLPSCFFKLFQ